MILKVSQYLERIRMSKISPYLTGDILDIGCGYGSVLRHHSPSFENYVGIDHNPLVIKWLQKHYPEYKFIQVDIDTELIPDSNKFDTILMIAVIEHLTYPDKLVKILPRLLKPNGKVVLTTPTTLGGWIHTLGGELGIFSREAKEDHKGFYNQEL